MSKEGGAFPSEMALNYLRECDEAGLGGLLPEDRRESEETERWDEELTDRLLESLEGLTQQDFDFDLMIQKIPDAVEAGLDNRYTRALLRKVPRMVARTMQLRALPVQRIPARPTNIYLREATRCYVHGFWQASVALSRAAVEHGLKDRYREVIGLECRSTLDEMVENAVPWRLLDAAHQAMAERVRIEGNAVLHREQPADERKARDALEAARGTLSQLYSSG